MNYIPADKLVAEIKRQQRNLTLLSNTEQVSVRRDCALQNGAYDYILSIITSLQQEPRFPQYDNIVNKVFGAGNLEGFEYREAEMLVALAKEELLKSLQQEKPEVDLDEYVDMELSHYGLSRTQTSYATLTASTVERIIRNAFKVGLNARKEVNK